MKAQDCNGLYEGGREGREGREEREGREGRGRHSSVSNRENM